MPNVSLFLPENLPKISLIIADILQRSIILTLLFFALTFGTKISMDLNDLSYKLLNRLKYK